VGALGVVIENGQYLGGAAVAGHAVRRHGVEAGCLPCSTSDRHHLTAGSTLR
jgi:hypothetical protein